MTLTRSTLERLKLLTFLVTASAAAGGFYSVVRTPAGSSPVAQLASGVIIGGVISSCIIGFELFGASPLFDRSGRRLPLVTAVLLQRLIGPTNL
jgi:hypothetical protein